MEYEDKMYPNYVYYETPKLVTVGLKSNTEMTESQKNRYNKNERFVFCETSFKGKAVKALKTDE